tara:strand:- start:682 stop:903 length:222 start_codon:yes stop_codon:yes gene_type:complete
MIQSDPEFYRKIVALNQVTAHKLKITVTGDSLRFYLGDKHVGDMNAGLFFKLEPMEILKNLGVSNEHRKSWLS